MGAPVNGIIEVAGPEQFRMDDFFREVLRDDPRAVVTDPHTTHFGAELGEHTLLPRADAILGEIRYRDWPGHAGRKSSSPAGHDTFLHELELTVRAELAEAEAGRPAVGLPVEEWLSDPAEDQRYEVGLRGLLGAVEAAEEGSSPRDQ